MYDEMEIWRWQPNFQWWLDKAPLDKRMRAAVQLAREMDRKKP